MLRIIRETWQGFTEDKASRLAAAIAYATIMSLAPLIIVIVAVAGALIGTQNGGHGHRIVEDALLGPIRQYAGPSAAATVQQLVAASFNKPRQGAIAQIVGWAMFVLGAMGLFGAIQDALNAVWHIEASKSGWRQLLHDRLAAFAMIGVVSILLMLALGLSTFLNYLGAHQPQGIPIVGSGTALTIANAVFLIAIMSVIFALVFKMLPDVAISWRNAWIGGIVTGVLFAIGEELLSVYFSIAGIASGYGAAGSLLAALVWIYCSAMIFLLGAEFTKAVSLRAATPRRPQAQPASHLRSTAR